MLLLKYEYLRQNTDLKLHSFNCIKVISRLTAIVLGSRLLLFF
jgi:hypothetical protein